MGFTNFKKTLVITSASFGLAMFMACGDETTITETSGIATLKAGEKLSQCDDSNDGEMLYVADSSAANLSRQVNLFNLPRNIL